MNLIVGIILVVALSMMPAPPPSESGVQSTLQIQAGTDGTKVKLRTETPGDLKAIIELESPGFDSTD